MGQHHQCLAAGHARQPGRLQGLWRIAAQHAAGDQAVRQWLQHNPAPEFFHHHHALHRPQAHAVVLGRNVEAAEAEFCQFGVGGTRKAAGARGLAATVKAVALVDPFAHGVTQLVLVFREIKVHGVCPVGSVAAAGRVSPAPPARRCCVVLRCCRRRWWSCAC